jgi:general secretion pathway protein D
VRMFLVVVLLASLTAASSAAGIGTALVGASLSQLSADALRISLDFSPAAPTYAVTGDGTAQLSITLTATARRTNGGFALPRTLTFRSVKIDQLGNDLVVSISSGRPLTAHLVPGIKSLTIIVSVLEQARQISTAAGPIGNDSSVDVIRLKYADVNEVAALLGVTIPSDQLAGGQVTSQGITLPGSSTAVNNPSTPQTIPAAPIGLRISDTVLADRRLNAIILIGPSSQTAGLKRLVEAIDAPVPAVLLEVSVVELTDSAARDLGIDPTSTGGQIASASMALTSGGRATGSINLQAAVYDEVQKGNGKIIARPKVYAQSGVPASILTGDALPVLTNISYPGSGSSIVQQQVQYVNVGVSLQILATVDPRNVVHSRIVASVSSVTGYVQGIPQISQRQATTSADVTDGQAVVIGGLVQETTLSTVSRAPWFSAIPLIGGLFNVRHDSFQKTDLYIVVTPHVLVRE